MEAIQTHWASAFKPYNQAIFFLLILSSSERTTSTDKKIKHIVHEHNMKKDSRTSV